jgi:ABC-type cobalamin/Fe3+-siderophores transport system ATPase subunit
MFDGQNGHGEFADELKQHFDLVAITDHMRCEFATQVSIKTGTSETFVVLPGMEVNFRPEAALGCVRIHLLVILPEGSTKEAFARLFAGLAAIPDDGQRTGNEEVTGIPLKEWVTRVHEENGVCIAAHVDNAQGLRCRFRQTARDALRLFCEDDAVNLERDNNVGEALKEYLFQSGIDAVEITKGTDAPHYRWVSDADGRSRCIPTTLTFDAHYITEFCRPERITHMKMTRLGLNGLKDALSFPDTRIRFPQDLPSPQSPVVLGMQIIGGNGSFFDDVVVAFTDNLNCLIGARGSGKSTIVEALRYIFGYNRSLGEVDTKLTEQIRSLQAANLADCLIRVAYRTSSGDERVLEATFDPKSDYSTKLYTINGEYLDVADVELTGEFPLRLYGWSEIETIGRNANRQRDLLDRFIPQLSGVIRRRAEIRSRLVDNHSIAIKAVHDLLSALNKSDGEIRRFREYSADFEKLNTDEVRNLFASLDLAQGKLNLLSKLKASIELVRNRLGSADKLVLRDQVEELLDSAQQDLRDWWSGQEVALLGVLGVEQDMQGFIRQGLERLRIFEHLIDQHMLALGADVEKVEQGLRGQFAGDTSKQRLADLRANAKRRLEHVTTLRENYLRALQVLQDTIHNRGVMLQELTTTQNEIAGIRAQHNTRVRDNLNQFLPTTMQVSIDFQAGGDTAAFITAVTPMLSGAGKYKARHLPAIVGRFTNPIEFSAMVLQGNLSALKGKKIQVGDSNFEMTAEDIDRIQDTTSLFAQDESANVPVLLDNGKRLENILKLQEVEWDDQETILLNGRPVSGMSPGQRSSAMLPLIALAHDQNTPLLIDQPEDNLDKRLIGNVLANVLAQLKEKRQIIVCTHDPNIVVGGDAEQVIVLDAVSDRKGRVTNHGSIDNPDIVQTIIDLLEGGKEAFDNRRKRYSR